MSSIIEQSYTKAGQVAKTMNAFIHAVKRGGKPGLKALREVRKDLPIR